MTNAKGRLSNRIPRLPPSDASESSNLTDSISSWDSREECVQWLMGSHGCEEWSLQKAACDVSDVVSMVPKKKVMISVYNMLAFSKWTGLKYSGERCVAAADQVNCWLRGVLCVERDGEEVSPSRRLFVSHDLGAALAVVEVVGDAHHAGCACVVGRRRLGRSSAPHAAQHQHGGAWSRRRVHSDLRGGGDDCSSGHLL